MPVTYQYDIALSFAEEDKDAANSLKLALRIEGFQDIYYYPDYTKETWGKNLAKQLAVIYAVQAKYAVVFLSKHYFLKKYTNIEFDAIQKRVKEENPNVYMLPVLIGNADDLGWPEMNDIVFINWHKEGAEGVAAVLKLLLGKKQADILKEKQYEPYRSFFINDKYKKTVGKIWKTVRRIPWWLITTAAITAITAVYGISTICLPHKNEKIALPGGSFTMGLHSGRAADMPTHTVIVKPFSISSTEVSVSQYRRYCDSENLPMPVAPGYAFTEDCPVVNITWQEAYDYCKWVGGRLPTEAEWEYAALKNGNGTTHRYSGGNNINKVGFYETNSGGKAHPVSQKCGGKLNLHDMSGNVAEWCADWYAPYRSTSQTDPLVTDSSSGRRVLRGGHYASPVKPDPEGNQLRFTCRNNETPNARKPYIGFRVVWDK